MRSRVITLAVAVGALALAAPAGAKTFDVTRLADTAPNGCNQGDCTLREAVLAANARPGPDAVVVKSGKTYGLSMLGTLEDAGVVGDLDVTGPLMIRRSDRKRATIDAQGIDRVLDAFAPLTLSGVEVRAGTTGVRATDKLTLRSSVIAANTGYGVQTLLPGGAIKLDRSRIFSNDFQGIQQSSEGSITLVDSKVTGNDNQGIQQNVGGGIKLTRSSVSGNEHQGIQQYSSGSVTLIRSKVSGNGHQGIQEYDEGSVLLRRASSTGNGNQGVQEYDEGTVRLVRGRVSGNQSSGIQTYDEGGLTIARGTISGNTSLAVVVEDEGRARIDRTRITGNDFSTGLTASGTGGLTLTRSRVAGGSRGVWIGDGVDAVIRDSTIEGNEGDDGGAGIYLAPLSSLQLRGSTIANNTTEGVSGGGVLVNANASLRATNSTLSGNQAFFSGGGIWVAGGGATVDLNGVTIVRNVANYTGFSTSSRGGGFGSAGGGGVAEVRNTLFALNTAPFGAGAPDCYANLGSLGHNLLTDTDGCTSLVGSDDETANPKIGALKRNGGPTRTAALKRGSPAIGGAGNDAPARDQRGRKRDANPDIGAFER